MLPVLCEFRYILLRFLAYIVLKSCIQTVDASLNLRGKVKTMHFGQKMWAVHYVM